MECQIISSSHSERSKTEVHSSYTTTPMLGKLRRELLLEISGNERRIAETSEIMGWIKKQYANNPVSADISVGILSAKYDLVLEAHDLPSLEDGLRALVKLEKRPLPDTCFVSATEDEQACGVLIQRYELEGGGIGYSTTIYHNTVSKVICVNIRARQSNPEPVSSIFSTNGWLQVETQSVAEHPYISFALRCVAAYHGYQYPVMDPDQIEERGGPKARPNPYLLKLITKAFKGHVICTKAKVPMELIEPRDLDHALAMPNEQIQATIDALKEGTLLELLLYEENGKLVMDDDYLAYLAYKALNVKLAPAVIMGSFSAKNIKILCTGREELIPPVGLARITSESRTQVIDKRQMLDSKLSPLRKVNTPLAKLEAKFVYFCRLLGSRSTKERDLHQFILKNPEILDCHLASIFSEVKIGRYRADLVLRYQQADKRVVLIELERHNGRIFTNSGRLREKVTHACQQVEDWIEQIRTNSPGIPDWLSSSYTPEGAVVIGRASGLTPEEREKLFHINSNRLVKIMTYDDLLERMTQLMLMLEGDLKQIPKT